MSAIPPTKALVLAALAAVGSGSAFVDPRNFIQPDCFHFAPAQLTGTAHASNRSVCGVSRASSQQEISETPLNVSRVRDTLAKFATRNDVSSVEDARELVSAVTKLLSGRKLRVYMREWEPLSGWAHEGCARQPVPEDACYRGYLPDLVRQLSHDLGFPYVFVNGARYSYKELMENTALEWYINLFLGVHFADNLA